MSAVDSFYDQHLGSPDFMSVHMRGSDKVIEAKNLDELNKQYKAGHRPATFFTWIPEDLSDDG